MFNIEDVFNWMTEAVNGSVDVLGVLADGVGKLFITTSETGSNLTILGVLSIAAVGAPLAWKFVKYIISLFNKVKPN